MSRPRAEGGADYLVTVCDACLRASCWHWEFPCHRARRAGTRDILALELRKLDREHPSNYSREKLIEVTGAVPHA